mmetsp:Transcript_7159/g.28170  ORF Transcript_7159/g.28170 Transcript_7159/m.28170 type:complete len:674 (-) Transcript_7159:127-2148(-)
MVRAQTRRRTDRRTPPARVAALAPRRAYPASDLSSELQRGVRFVVPRRVSRDAHDGEEPGNSGERLGHQPRELRVPVRHVRSRVRQGVDAPPERLDRGVLRGAPAARRSLLAVDPGDVGDGNLRSRLRLRKPNPAPGGVKPPPRAPPGDPQREQTVHALARERPVRRGERRRGASRFANLALLGPETVGSERDEAGAILRVFRDDLDAPFGVEAPGGVLANVDADGGRRAVEDGRDGARAPAPSAAYVVLLARRFPRSFVFVVVAMGAAREFDSRRERVHEHLVRLPPRHRYPGRHRRGDDVRDRRHGDGHDVSRVRSFHFVDGVENDRRDVAARPEMVGTPIGTVPANEPRLPRAVDARRDQRARHAVEHRRARRRREPGFVETLVRIRDDSRQIVRLLERRPRPVERHADAAAAADVARGFFDGEAGVGEFQVRLIPGVHGDDGGFRVRDHRRRVNPRRRSRSGASSSRRFRRPGLESRRGRRRGFEGGRRRRRGCGRVREPRLAAVGFRAVGCGGSSGGGVVRVVFIVRRCSSGVLEVGGSNPVVVVVVRAGPGFVGRRGRASEAAARVELSPLVRHRERVRRCLVEVAESESLGIGREERGASAAHGGGRGLGSRRGRRVVGGASTGRGPGGGTPRLERRELVPRARPRRRGAGLAFRGFVLVRDPAGR